MAAASPWTWISLLPAAVAVVLWGRVARRHGGIRWRETGLAVLLLVLAALLLLAGRYTGRERVVFVFEPGRPEAVAAACARLDFPGPFLAQGIVLTDASTAAHEPSPRWFALRQHAASSDLPLVPAGAAGVNGALDTALDRFRALGWAQIVWDGLWSRRWRVVVVTSDPETWRKFPLDPGHAHAAERLGVRVDVLRLERLAEATRLDVRFSPARVAALTPLSPACDVILSVRSPALTQAARSAAGAPVAQPARIACTINAGVGSAGWAYAYPQAGAPPTGTLLPDGELVFHLPLGNFTPAPAAGWPASGLENGFHLVEATVELTGGVASGLTAEGSAYLEARTDKLGVLVGTANGLGNTVGTRSLDERVTAITDAIRSSRKDGRWPASLDLEALVRKAGDANGADEVIQNTRIIVAHDFNDTEWTTVGPKLREAVEQQGKTLVVSVTPTARAAGTLDPAAWLPALAEPDGVVCRRPVLCVSFDDSRLSWQYGLVPTTESAGYVLDATNFTAKKSWRELERTLAALARTKLDELVKPPGGTSQLSALDPDADHRTDGVEQAGDAFVRVVSLVAPDLSIPAGAALSEATDREISLKIDLIENTLRRVHRRAPPAAPPAPGAPAPATPPASLETTATAVLLFIVDAPQSQDSIDRLRTAIQAGRVILPVVLHSPFLPPDSPTATALKKIKEELEAPRAPHVKGKLLWEEDQRLELPLGDPTSVLQGAADQIAARLRPYLHPQGMIVARGAEGRFFDERSGFRYAPGGPLPIPAGTSAWTPPWWTQRLRIDAGRSDLTVGASLAPTAEGPTDRPVEPLAAWSLLGGGQVVCLGYSLFEGTDPLVSDLADSRFARDARIVTPAEAPTAVSPLGLQRVLEPTALTAALLPLPGGQPSVASLEIDPATRDLRIHVAQRVDPTSSPGSFRLRLNATAPAVNVPARLADFDPSRGDLTYLVLAADLREELAKRGLPPQADVATIQWSPDGTRWIDERRCGLPAAGSPAKNFGAWSALPILAAYTGGQEAINGDALSASQVRARGILAGMLGAALAVFLGMGALRRVLQRRRLRAEAAREARQQEAGPLGITGAAELLGQAVPNQRVGAYGGIRAFEPGDRLSSALPMDLLMMTGAVQWENNIVIPRVPLHIKEQAPPLCLMVQLAASVRVPTAARSRRDGPEPEPVPVKVATLARTAGLLAQAAAGHGAEVTVCVLGTDGPRPEENFSGDCSAAVRNFLTSCATDRAASNRRACPELPPEIDGNLIYLSDFLMETPEEVQRWVEAQVAEGRGVGGVLVYSPAELRFVETGFTRSPWVWCNRVAWTAEDTALAHRQLRREIAGAFDAAAGGLCVLTTNQGSESIAEAVAGSRLVEILR